MMGEDYGNYWMSGANFFRFNMVSVGSSPSMYFASVFFLFRTLHAHLLMGEIRFSRHGVTSLVGSRLVLWDQEICFLDRGLEFYRMGVSLVAYCISLVIFSHTCQ